LLFLVAEELFVLLLVLAIDEFEFLASGAGKVRNHHLNRLRGEEAKLSVCPGGVFLDLLPKQKVFLQLFEPRMIFF
jgi:hypothetical protein